LVAGLKEYYSAEELVGKKIIVVTNLKYAKLRGIESQGMLLAGDDGKHVGLLFVKDASPGTPVLPDEHQALSSQISFKDFQKINLKAKGGKAYFEDFLLKAGDEGVKVEKVKDGNIS
jgi:methionyl-tRNA synthetase